MVDFAGFGMVGIRPEFEAFVVDVCDEASVEAKHQLHEEKSQAADHRDDGGCSQQARSD